jgi:NAD+ synthase
VTLSIALAQVNPTVGDVAGNAALVRRSRDEAATLGADLVVFSALVLVGYPPEDLVLRPSLRQAAAATLRELEQESATGGPGLVVTLPCEADGRVHNAVALVADGRSELRFKHELPNYGVFDEKRVFEPGPVPEPIEFRGTRLGIPICEDIWFDTVSTHLARRGAELLLVPNGSPYELGKFHQRLELARARAAEAGLPLAYVNQVGGQDELVFDGGSFVVGRNGHLAQLLPFWRESLVMTRWCRVDGRFVCEGSADWIDEPWTASVYNAMMLGLRDYVRKNGFRGVVLGLSGGIDSALTVAVAVDALGADRVRGVRLPSPFTSTASMEDAAESARLLGIHLDTIAIHPIVGAAEASLAEVFAGRSRDVTEENLQARARGLVLMALSNKFGDLLVTTGNKSEMSVGYATLYGDMCGGYSVLKDVYKTQVYALARYRNAARPKGCLGPAGTVIPENVLTKAPTAELKANQRDQDTLPPYDVLDDILNCLVELEMPLPEIVARGHAPELVKKVERMLYLAEYKRRQAAPGVKITAKNFGRDRRYPITNKFREKLSS